MQPNWIKKRAELSSDKIGLRFKEQQFTFNELYIEAINYAQKLASFGIVKGERVAILAPSTPELLFVIYGCMHAQIEMVFLNLRLTDEELAYQIEDADVKAVLVHDLHLKKLPIVEGTLLFSQLKCAPESVQIEFSETWDENATTSIMYTSGTTGFPKGVRQTLKNHEASAVMAALNSGLSETDTWLCTVPIFHISGFSMLMKSILYGITLHLMERFDRVECAALIAKGEVTHMSVVSLTLSEIITELEENEFAAHQNFKLMLAGGGPVPITYLQRADALGLNVAQTYGMTETASQVATLNSADAMRKIGSCGKSLFMNTIRIEGATKALDEGEICIQGPTVTPGYIGRHVTLSTVNDGWLYTGDIGKIDEEGYLYIVDRRSDLIISGGENVYPAEIENVLAAHPNIVEAGVCGIEDERWGQVPAAFIVVNKSTSEKEIRKFCEKHLASYKIPKKVYFVEKLPRNGSNKLVRRKLKEE